MEKIDNKKAFKIKEGSTEEKTTIIFPKIGSIEIENCDDEYVKSLLEVLQIAFDQGYEKALVDKGF